MAVSKGILTVRIWMNGTVMNTAWQKPSYWLYPRTY